MGGREVIAQHWAFLYSTEVSAFPELDRVLRPIFEALGHANLEVITVIDQTRSNPERAFYAILKESLPRLEAAVAALPPAVNDPTADQVRQIIAAVLSRPESGESQTREAIKAVEDLIPLIEGGLSALRAGSVQESTSPVREAKLNEGSPALAKPSA